jgi:hypothetical protein
MQTRPERQQRQRLLVLQQQRVEQTLLRLLQTLGTAAPCKRADEKMGAKERLMQLCRAATQRSRCSEVAARMWYRSSGCTNVSTNSLLPCFDTEVVCIMVAE